MIYFNNVSLESVAPVKIADIHVSPIQISPLSHQRQIRFGADYVRMTGANRTVNIAFALLTNNMEMRQAQFRAITKWARSDKPKKLVLPYHLDLYLECMCIGLPTPSTRQWWENGLTMTFTTFENPYWTSIAEHTAACGTAFYAGGDAPPLMQITRTLDSAANNQAYSDGTDTMTFSTIPAGDMVIDLNRQTAAVGTTSIMQYYSFASSFIQPKTGTQTITGTGAVHWRERWE